MTDAEVGEACSGYNTNYLRTISAFIDLHDDVKVKVFQLLGDGGPMFGGSPDPAPYYSPDPSPGPGTLRPSFPSAPRWTR